VSTNAISVLHVDDDELALELIKHNLEKTDAEIVVYSEKDPHCALDTMKSLKFDCVLCDYEMPGLSGLQLLERIKEIDKQLPVIFISSQMDEKIAAQVLRAGATDYYTKSPDMAQYERLSNDIKRVVREQRELKRRSELEGLLKATI
jgi:CheY-like chemotaxis protein